MNTLFISGGAGFIGSNFVRYMLKKYPEYIIINYDLLTYAGNIENIIDLMSNPKHLFIQGDINDKDLLKRVMKENSIDIIINFAAESHVDRSILDSSVFIETNVLGTVSLLEMAKTFKVKKYIQISTDEVYGSLGIKGLFSEESPLKPNNPYAASKASADLLTLSYYQTYGLDINITRSSNNYGPHQHPEKLIPLMITNAMQNKILPVYGDGENIRDWLHVTDHCRAIDLVLHKGIKGAVYNIGGNNERTNNKIVDLIISELKVSKDLKNFVADRLGHDRRYAIDATKIETELGWKSNVDFEQSLKETIEWYSSNEQWWKPLVNE
ncbi:dTDP-glucose 4,6-dehydratase [Vagococcus sp.]|uniref:dTDP-glucose 4,6-dehydratase n=1 Tax=Vagococcus sp. TaxID=1933889 RepID=UPI003F9C5F02